MNSERRPSMASSRGDGRSPGGYEDEYNSVYDGYGKNQSTRTRSGINSRPQPGYISEEEDDGSFDEPEFDMISTRNSRQPQRRSQPEIKKIRVKVHAEDTRYVMIGVAVEFKDFADQIRAKFGIRQNFKVKIKDEGDMITMADQDDLEMAIIQSKSDARKDRNEMGRMEVCVPLLSMTECS